MRWFSWNRLSFLFVLFCLSPQNAAAIPIQWTLIGGLFDDGGTVTGSYVFDADGPAFSAVNIQTTAGTALPGVSYPDFADGDASSFVLYTDLSFLTAMDPDFTGVTILVLGLTSPMTNAGGVIPLAAPSQGLEFLCGDPLCGEQNGRFIVEGEISGEPFAAVPESSTLLLVGIGLGALWIRRRRFSSTS